MKLEVVVVPVSDVERAKQFHHSGTEGRLSGPDPKRGSYGSFATFSDPDGNGWLFQEVRQGAPGR